MLHAQTFNEVSLFHNKDIHIYIYLYFYNNTKHFDYKNPVSLQKRIKILKIHWYCSTCSTIVTENSLKKIITLKPKY